MDEPPIEAEYRELQPLARLISTVSSSPVSLARPADDHPCECGEWYPDHKCWTCHDRGFLKSYPSFREDRREDPEERSVRFALWLDAARVWRAEHKETAGKRIPCGCQTSSEPDIPSEMQRMRVPARFRDCRLDTWLPPHGKPRTTCVEYIASWPPAKPMLFLFGFNKGTGKTHLAVATLRAVFERHGQRGAFWPAVDLIDRYRAASNPERATETIEQIDAELRRTPVIVLDDYGAGKNTEFAAERVFRLVDERYREMRPLIVTSNADIAELEERVRSRVLSGFYAHFDGTDKRIEGAS